MKYEKIKVNSKKWLDLTLLLNEEFRDIEGYEGLYQVSNYGRVKSLTKVVEKEYHNNRIQREKILKQYKIKKYYYVKLQKNKNKYNAVVHRLVAKAFIPNPYHFVEVDHIIPIEKNCINRVDNLRWCTHESNMLDNKNTLKKINIKPVNCYDLKGNFIRTYRSMRNASMQLGLCQSNIKYCCEGHPHHKRVGKYRFKYFV